MRPRTQGPQPPSAEGSGEARAPERMPCCVVENYLELMQFLAAGLQRLSGGRRGQTPERLSDAVLRDLRANEQHLGRQLGRELMLRQLLRDSDCDLPQSFNFT